MKKILLTIIFLATAATAAQAQTMNIHKKDGSVVKISVSDIDYIDYADGNKNSGNVTGGKTNTVQGKPSRQQNVLADPGHLMSYRGKNGQIFSFKVTGKPSGRIWGGDNLVYTDDSPLAVAAVHAGLLRAGETGVVTVRILAGRSSYPSITRNGISTIQYGKYEGSYQFVTE